MHTQSCPYNLNICWSDKNTCQLTNTPSFNWEIGKAYNEKGYRILVSSTQHQLDADIGDLWDTGHVLQWDYSGSNKKGFAQYAGIPFSAGQPYYVKVMAWVGEGWGRPSAFSKALNFKAPMDLKSAREELSELVSTGKLNDIYLNTLQSLRNRIKPYGHAPTPLTGAYPGQFIRDTAAQLFAHLAAGDFAECKKMLSYLLDRHLELGLVQRAAHVLNDREDESGLDIAWMDDQPDGNYHLVVAYARVVMETGDHALEQKYYPLIRNFTNNYLSDQYIIPNRNLMLNTRLEHCRMDHYISAYDLMTNSMAIEALDRMAVIAQRNGEAGQADIWKMHKEKLTTAIMDRSNGFLTCIGGKEILGEVRLQDSPDDLLWGLSYVNWSQIPSKLCVPDNQYIDNLADIYEQKAHFLWGDYRVPFSAVCPDRQDVGINSTLWQVQGKQFAWETFYHSVKGNWNKLIILQKWLKEYNIIPLFGESFNYKPYVSSDKYIQDGGNQEQSGWWVWAQTKLRSILA